MSSKLPAQLENTGATRLRRPAQRYNAQATIDRILKCAGQVLIRHGYANFTTRRVAEAARISPGNLTYHFPSKRELVRALIAKMTADILKQNERFYLDPSVPSGEEIASLVRSAFLYSISKEGIYIFRELWAMALRDAQVRRAINALYDELVESVVQLVARSRPNIELKSIREYMQVIALMLEGSNVLYGTRKTSSVPYERIIEIATGFQSMLVPEVRKIAAN
jgi:AcrR family transcriptional regulator